ncbi:Ninjurin-1 [Frankliniella fusca]|uniref:Ninjurin-1 n=1 Tax=Frankliniella fusca TaxID=407009 RepID=A0AAE1LGL8_9NEOP|nr:Ninjurin-1 [Frankliniella fusca]
MSTMDVDTVSGAVDADKTKGAVDADKTKVPQTTPEDEVDTKDPEIDDALAPSKPLDANRYATKKTIAQGMLDIALLTANASQLKYILQVGPRHEFYSLMLGLIATSMILQVVLGVLFLSLNVMRDCRLHREEYKRSAEFINYCGVGGCVLVTAINLLASGLDPGLASLGGGHVAPDIPGLADSASAALVLVGIMFLVIGALNINKDKDKRRADILNDVILIMVFVISVTNVVIAGFGIDNASRPLRLLSDERGAYSR